MEQKNKVVAILQPNYIPWKGYFDMIRSVDEFILLDDVQYTHDWRNRNLIKTPNGPQWLSIPVRVRSLKDRINEIQVSDSTWKRKHLMNLVHNYSKSGYFKHYYDWLRELFLGHEETNLSRINYRFISAINDVLGITTPVTWSSDYNVQAVNEERVLKLCKKANASVYLSGPSARDYLHEEYFNEAGIEINWMEYSGYPEYPQLFPPFEHRVSIIDLLFNVGPEAKHYLGKAILS